MPTPLEVNGPAGLNALWRAQFGPTLSGADKVSLAGLLGVTRRTVERWVTAAGQMRSPFPLRLGALPTANWPDRYFLRAQATLAIAFGWVSREQSESEVESFTEPFAQLSQAILEVNALLEGELDPWLETMWRSVTLAKGARYWEWTITYERLAFDPSGRNPAREPLPLPPGSPGNSPQSATYLYPESLPLLQGYDYGAYANAARMTSFEFPRFGIHVYWRLS